MGKKINHQSQNKKRAGDKELQPATRQTIIHLKRRLFKATFKHKAPKAVKEIRAHAAKVMFTRDVRIDPELNQQLWANGIRNTDRRVEVVMERKKNEEDEDTKEKFYTVVRLAK